MTSLPDLVAEDGRTIESDLSLDGQAILGKLFSWAHASTELSMTLYFGSSILRQSFGFSFDPNIGDVGTQDRAQDKAQDNIT